MTKHQYHHLQMRFPQPDCHLLIHTRNPSWDSTTKNPRPAARLALFHRTFRDKDCHLRHITAPDSHHTDRLLALFQEATREGRITGSDASRLQFVALAEHVLARKPRNPGGLLPRSSAKDSGKSLRSPKRMRPAVGCTAIRTPRRGPSPPCMRKRAHRRGGPAGSSCSCAAFTRCARGPHADCRPRPRGTHRASLAPRAAPWLSPGLDPRALGTGPPRTLPAAQRARSAWRLAPLVPLTTVDLPEGRDASRPYAASG